MLTPGFRRAVLSRLSTVMTMTPLLLSLSLPALAVPSLSTALVPPASQLMDDGINNFVATQSDEDPLNSPYPMPWQWIMKTQQSFAEQGKSGLSYYRSPALVSPDGQYAAYSRIEVRSESELHSTKALSVMFLENLATGHLQVIRADSPIARYLHEVGEDSEEMAGVISILLPASWSANGQYLLARQVEGAFSTSDISDYAVVWNQQTKAVQTLQAFPDIHTDTTAMVDDIPEMSSVLLGWNQADAQQVLFQANPLGEEAVSLVSVGLDGTAYLAQQTTPATYGQLISRSWTGAQSLR